MTIGKQTFNLTRKGYGEKIGRIIDNHRVNTKLIGEPLDFILRSCRLCPLWSKLSSDPAVCVYLRNIDIAGGRKIKMISLERGPTKQPVSKSKLVDALYPVKKISTSATLEEKHYNAVKFAMRNGVASQLKEFRESVSFPSVCYLTGKQLRRGNLTDVDHVGISFAEIADSFVAMKSIKYVDIALSGPPTAKRFKDDNLWKEWQYFHEIKAKFSLVCASANRSKGSENYKTPESLYGSFAKQDPEEVALDF